MKRPLTFLAGPIVLSVGLLVPLAPPTSAGVNPDSAERASYSSCDQLNRDYSHGVSNRHMSKRQWIRKGATAKGAYRPRLYKRVSANLDRDKDHIACES